MNINTLKYYLVEIPVTYDFSLHLRVCDHTPWFWRCVRTACGPFPLGSWLVCEVALMEIIVVYNAQ